MDCSLPGSSICGTFQARILQWVAIFYSRGSSRPKDRTVSPVSPALQTDSLPLSQSLFKVCFWDHQVADFCLHLLTFALFLEGCFFIESTVGIFHLTRVRLVNVDGMVPTDPLPPRALFLQDSPSGYQVKQLWKQLIFCLHFSPYLHMDNFI